MHMAEAVRRHMLEVMALVAVPVMAGIGVPEGAVITPIAIGKGSVIAVIIAVVIIGATGHAHTDRLAAGATRRRDQNQKSPGGVAGAFAHFILHTLAPDRM